MNKEELKIQALRERIGQLASSYEEQLADFRVEATMQIQQLQQEIERLEDALEEKDAEITSHEAD